MPTVEIIQYANIGLQNDEREISKILKEEPFRRLKEVRLTSSGDRVQIHFTKKVLNELDGGNNFCRYKKRVLQISKKKYKDVKEHIDYVLDNEPKPCSTFRKKHDWQIFEIINLEDKWLVFLSR